MAEVNQPRDPWKPRYFLDTEFTSFETCQLISVAIVGEDGSEFYGECTDFERPLCSDFVRAVVLPQLGQFPGRAMPFAQLRSDLLAWLSRVPMKPKPVLCFDFEGDLQLVEHLIGGSLPRGWKTENIYDRLDAARLAAYFAQHGAEHHALHDARANACAFI
jgi:3' exoribonuclease, RNase T-like